jgi:hypothetical protein
LQIILELIWNKQQFESDEAFQNLTYWKVLRICKLNVLIQKLTTCVPETKLPQISGKYIVPYTDLLTRSSGMAFA